jgi:hypothetical protein
MADGVHLYETTRGPRQCRPAKFLTRESPMRGWIILDSLMTLTGLVSLASGKEPLGSAISLSALGLILLTLSLGAKMVRGRA